jgi:hypothetical protein
LLFVASFAPLFLAFSSSYLFTILSEAESPDWYRQWATRVYNSSLLVFATLRTMTEQQGYRIICRRILSLLLISNGMTWTFRWWTAIMFGFRWALFTSSQIPIVRDEERQNLFWRNTGQDVNGLFRLKSLSSDYQWIASSG